MFKNANIEQDIICYDNSFITDVIGSRKVTTLLKYKAHNTTPHIEHKKSYHEKIGMFTQRRLVIILKIRSKLTPFFFAILEDSDIPPVIGSETLVFLWILTSQTKNHVRYNFTNFKQKSKRNDFVLSFFAKSPTVYEDLKRLHEKTVHR